MVLTNTFGGSPVTLAEFELEEKAFELNKRADKAAVFAGWKEMNDYMRENKIEEVKPVIPVTKPAAPASAPASAPDSEEDAPAPAQGKKGH